MSEPVDAAAETPAAMQFETAEFAAPAAMQCVACQREILDSYYDLNGHALCAGCSKVSEGSLFNALAYGAGAAALGSLVWWGVAELLNMQLALIAIGIGWGVGKGVRRGAGMSPSIGYSLLAVVLTYASIAGATFLSIPSEHEGHHIGVVLKVIIAVIAPVMEGSPIGLLIIAFGLWEAWKFSRMPFTIRGPFPVAKPIG